MAELPSLLHGYLQRLRAAPEFPGKQAMLDTVQHLAKLDDSLIALFPQLNQGKVDNPFLTSNQGAATPPAVSFSVTQKNGISYVNIKLPQLNAPGSAGLFTLLVQQGPNAVLAPIYHRVQSAASANFDQAAGIAEYDLGIGVWALPDANPQWRLQSSFDTITFNDFSAPQAATLLP